MNDCDQICLNTDGSYTCSCRDGFILDNDRRSCLGKCNMFMHICASYLWEFVTLHTVLGTNRCPDNNACSDICTLVNDVPTCDCSPGYMLQSDGQSCEGMYACVTMWHFGQYPPITQYEVTCTQVYTALLNRPHRYQ